jgi:CheY-like chemotaxis protein
MKPSLLVIDDDDAVRRLLVAIFGREGFAVTEATNGEDALHLLSSGEYDAITLDLMMPKLGGAEVLRLLGDQSSRRNIVVLTAAHPRQFEELDRRRVAAVMRKPFDLDELRAQILRLRRPEVLVVEDNPADQYLIRDCLMRGGYAVTVVRDGREALQTLNENEFNAIVVDIRLPIISGYDVLEAVSTRPGHPPTVVLSMLDQFERELAADVILRKPYGLGELVPALQRLIA